MDNADYKQRIKCGACGGENLITDGIVSWDFDKQTWAVEHIGEPLAWCENCEADTHYCFEVDKPKRTAEEVKGLIEQLAFLREYGFAITENTIDAELEFLKRLGKDRGE